MMPLRGRALLSAQWSVLRRAVHTGAPASGGGSPSNSASSGASQPAPDRPGSESVSGAPEALTGSAKLFADALAEESLTDKKSNPRDHLVHSQGPIWTGEESQSDAVLRMLVDKYPALRSGEGIKADAADQRIRSWMKNLDMEAKHPVNSANSGSTEVGDGFEIRTSSDSPHRTKIPPHLHRPWHATYTGDDAMLKTPQIKFGRFDQSPGSKGDFASLLELRLPPNADGTTKAKYREFRKGLNIQGRLGSARESAIDYRLGIADGDMTHTGAEDEEMDGFSGNRQIRGNSVLGAAKGGASGMRAWTGLVEERITSAQAAGFFKNLKGSGAPIERDESEKNPHLGLSEVYMNRIIKRQGALPPWIELQNNLNSSHRAFRTQLLEAYTKHIVRAILSTHRLDRLPSREQIPGSDEAFEARERKFHEESIRQLNDTLGKMNAQAPMPSRRGLILLENELERVRGEVLRSNVWNELQKRAQEIKEIEAHGPKHARQPFLATLENGAIARLGHRLGSAFGSATGSGGEGHSGGGTVSGNKHHEAGGGKGVIILAGLTIGVVFYFKKPTYADSTPYIRPDLIPVHDETAPSEPEEEDVQGFVAMSVSEPVPGVLETLREYILEPFLTFVRFIHLALLFGPVILTAPMVFVGAPPRRKPGKPITEREDNWGAVWWYGFLVKQMERAGPSFIKLGQWAASRTDLFPAALCEKMSKLHSSNNPHPFRYTKKVLQRAFQLPFDDIFEYFEEKPIGCGAIAQVYRARLRPEIITASSAETAALARDLETQDGDRRIVTSVAIKVLHPRVEKLVRRDIKIMSVFANLINALPDMEWLSLPDEVQAFGDMMNQQLDLRVEAANLDRFRANFAHRPRTVVFPRPIKLGPSQVAANREVLVEEYEDALPLKYFLRNGGGPYDEQIANLGLDAFLEMLLLDNWTHGDLHPGNIMVRLVRPETYHIIGPLLHRLRGDDDKGKKETVLPTENVGEVEIVHALRRIANDQEAWLDALDAYNADGYVPQLCFIDAGLVTSLDATNRRNFLDLFQAVAEFDGYRAGKLMVERCRRPDLAIDEETFALKIQHLVLNVKSKTFSLAKIKISDILNDVLVAVRQHHVKLEGDFVNTVLSILLLEGIGRQLDPNMDLFKSALPILRQVGRQMGTRDAIAHAGTGNLLAMAKLWIWAEARSVVGESSQMDKWVRYDWLAPGI